MTNDPFQLFVPPLGTQLELVKDWQFTLQWEYRNRSFWDALKLPIPEIVPSVNKYYLAHSFTEQPTELYAGNILKVVRVYIKQNQSAYDSLTFIVQDCLDNPKLNKKRFWVKLAEVNTMQVRLTSA